MAEISRLPRSNRHSMGVAKLRCLQNVADRDVLPPRRENAARVAINVKMQPVI